MSFFPKIKRWHFSANLLEHSRADMAVDGRNGNEGTCFWLGRRAKGEAVVSHVVFLRGHGVRKSPMNVIVNPDLMREVHELAERLKLTLVGQVHSHSSLCGVDMSSSDRAYGVSVPYFLSVIYPDFAQDPATTLLECGVYVWLPERGYVRLHPKELKKKIFSVADLATGTSAVGENHEN